MKTRNCHARSKQKAKQLRMKRMQTQKLIKDGFDIMANNPDHPKAKAAQRAMQMKLNGMAFDSIQQNKYSIVPVPNQRQRRKLRRQQPHGK